MDKTDTYFKGRGAQINTPNPYLKDEYIAEHIEGIDEPYLSNSKTEYFHEYPRKIVNKVDSPDLGLMYSMNPYQGCEHGCIYCYARNTHQYWGFSAGLDFERKIIVKENAPELLKTCLDNPKWKPQPIMLSGNTDCYQPIERKLGITRKLLEILLEYRQSVSIITKNSLILRDMDILTELTKYNLLHVSISITTLNETLRQKMEPRTATSQNRLKLVRALASANIPVNVMTAPIIPGLNSHEIPELIRESAEHGASSAGYTIVRLNGAVKDIFQDWLRKNFPDSADKVLHQIAACHGGKLNDSRFGIRMKGEGKISESIATLFRISKQKYMKGRRMRPFDLDAFQRPQRGQLELFYADRN